MLPAHGAAKKRTALSVGCPLLTFLFMLILPGYAEPPVYTIWKTLAEGRDESRYELALDGSVTDGMEIWWFGCSSSGDRNNDWAQVKVFGARGQLVGCVQVGRRNDNRPSVTGWHAIYIVLPAEEAVNRLVLILHLPGGSPKLVSMVSWARAWNAGSATNFAWYGQEGRVAYTSIPPRGRVWMHADGLEISAPRRATIDYVVWRSFRKPPAPSGFSANPDVSVDASYAGTINVTNDSWTGRGGYMVGISVGIADSHDTLISNVLRRGKVQKLWEAKEKAPGDAEAYVNDILKNEASGVTDIFLDAVEASEVSYAKFIADCLELVAHAFSVDAVVAERRTVVYDALPLRDSYGLAWLRFKAVIAAVGLSHTVLSFYCDGLVEGDLKGNRGMELGCIGLHYQGPQSPEVVSTEPAQGATNLSLRPELRFVFSSNIQVYQAGNVVLRTADGTASIPCTVSASGNVLVVKPNQDLAGSTSYTLTVNPGAVRQASTGVANLAASTLRFCTGVPLTIVDTVPPNNASGIALQADTTLVFNAAVSAGDVINSIAIKKASGQTVATTARGVRYSFRPSEKKVVLSLDSPLEPAQQYFWEIPRGAFRDEKGSPNVAHRWGFTTALPIRVVDTVPRRQEADVPFITTILVRFNQTIAAGPNVSSISVRSASGAVRTAATFRGDTLELRLSSSLALKQRYTVTLPQGALKNEQTGVLSEPFTFDFETAEPPAVVGSLPAHGSRNAYRDDPIVVRFSEPVRAGNTFSSISVRAGGAPIAYQAGTRYNELVILPASVLPANTGVSVMVPAGAVTDVKGTPLQTAFNFQFTTGASGSPPRIASTSPADGETGVSLNVVIVARFTKSIAQDSSWNQITLKDEGGSIVPVQTLVSYGTQVEIRPAQALKRNRLYTVTLPAGCVKESLGTPFPDGYTWSFRTAWTGGGGQAQ
ncbi:hypothetical protein HRbin16_01998 [bacterium HR16]|nr:hypothetical protein HRbin16_01998 [bacterium HR16]